MFMANNSLHLKTIRKKERQKKKKKRRRWIPTQGEKLQKWNHWQEVRHMKLYYACWPMTGLKDGNFEKSGFITGDGRWAVCVCVCVHVCVRAGSCMCMRACLLARAHARACIFPATFSETNVERNESTTNSFARREEKKIAGRCRSKHS